MARIAHRGFQGNRHAFAKAFVLSRLEGFEKDIRICLTPAAPKEGSKPTHAYFPALAACCGTLEYLAALHRGRVNGLGWPDVSAWADRYLPQPDYAPDPIRILVDAFRNAVAHRGIATGVWVDRKPGDGRGRRLTWKILANSTRPPVRIVAENGVLKNDPPWPCPYSHRVHIHLKALATDICKGAVAYADDLTDDQQLTDKFFKCMGQLYPE